MICYLFEAPTYLIYAPDLPEILYYSHIPTTVIALLVGLFVFLNNRKALPNRLLLLIALCFAGWTTTSLLAWTNINADFIAFIWPLFAVFAALLSILSVYFVYVFLYREDAPFWMRLVFIALLAPVILLAHTDLSVSGFNIASCDAFDYEGFAYKVYYTVLGFLAMAWIGVMLVQNYRKALPEFRKQIVYMGIGIEFFLFSFISITFIITSLTTQGYFVDSRLEMYGLFGMVVFMVMIGILIVRFKSFNVGALTAQALVVTLLLLIGSQLTFTTSTTSTILTVITLLLTSVAGYILVKNVKVEVQQRKEIEGLAKRLEKANKRLKVLDKMKSEFVSIASHQLRSPLTAIRGYTSMLIEGSYGKLSKKAEEAVQRIHESSRFMALSVEDYLNVSRIEAGNMKYEISDFNLKAMAEKVVDEVRPAALKKGLLLVFRSDCDGSCSVHADIGKTRQIIMNLIDNAMKYTPKGTITVIAHDDVKKKKMIVSVVDTGVGMSKETIEDVFDKFVRAENANHVNVTGTGLGLFVAKKMAEEMKGRIWAESEGEGEGSTFHIELPLLPGKFRD